MEKEAHIQNTDIGNIHISEEVIAVIAGIAATEGPEVYSLVGNITNEIVSKMGIKSLSKGIRVEMAEDTVTISVTVNLVYGYNIPKTCKAIQERIIPRPRAGAPLCLYLNTASPPRASPRGAVLCKTTRKTERLLHCSCAYVMMSGERRCIPWQT